ncbi:MAG: hypothetical protein ACREJ3_11020 [Polyangiaceae bacterium]
MADLGRRRVAFALCLLISAAAHFALAPIDLPHGFQVKDTEGVAAIPVDLLGSAEPSPPNPPEDKAGESRDRPRPAPAARRAARDAVAPRDASAAEASIDASGRSLGDASGVAAMDAGVPEPARADAGEGAEPRDPQGIVGAAGAIQADVIYVMLVINAEVIRQNPVGAGLGYLLRGIPQWDEFMSGTNIDPLRDTDWVIVSGPSLVNTAHDVILIHYSAPDAVVDHAVSIVSRKYDRGGPYDAGVPGVKASLAHADGAERVLLRPQPHVLAVVPSSVAEKVARQLVSSRLPAHVRPGEAVYLRLVDPHHPMPEVPAAITELRLRALPRADGGADVFVDSDTKDAAAARQAAGELRALVRRHNDPLTSMVTHGLLDHVDVTTDGPRVLLHMLVTRDQIETIAALVGAFLGVEPPEAPGQPATTGAAPRLR